MHSGPARITSIGSIDCQIDPGGHGGLGGRDHALAGHRVGQAEQPAAHVLLDLGDDAVLGSEVVLVPDLAIPGEFAVVVVGTTLAERAARQAR